PAASPSKNFPSGQPGLHGPRRGLPPPAPPPGLLLRKLETQERTRRRSHERAGGSIRWPFAGLPTPPAAPSATACAPGQASSGISVLRRIELGLAETFDPYSPPLVRQFPNFRHDREMKDVPLAEKNSADPVLIRRSWTIFDSILVREARLVAPNHFRLDGQGERLEKVLF